MKLSELLNVTLYEQYSLSQTLENNCNMSENKSGSGSNNSKPPSKRTRGTKTSASQHDNLKHVVSWPTMKVDGNEFNSGELVRQLDIRLKQLDGNKNYRYDPYHYGSELAKVAMAESHIKSSLLSVINDVFSNRIWKGKHKEFKDGTSDEFKLISDINWDSINDPNEISEFMIEVKTSKSLVISSTNDEIQELCDETKHEQILDSINKERISDKEKKSKIYLHTKKRKDVNNDF